MRKQLFYVFDEHTDYVNECKKLGMQPIKGYPFVKEFIYDHSQYKTFGIHECYSGWTITIAALNIIKYDMLIKILMTTKVYDEIVGCLGLLLKYYLQDFISFLYLTDNSNRRTRKIKKIIINELSERCTEVALMTELLKLCKL